MESSSVDHKKLKLTPVGSRRSPIIDDLPDECLTSILSFLHSSRDRCSASAVSRKWLHLMATAKVSGIQGFSTPPRSFSRRLMGSKANDVRLASLAVRAHHPRLALTGLCIMGVPRSTSITDYGLEIIAKASPSLKSLDIWDCDSVGDAGFKAVGRWCRDLERIHLINTPRVSDDGLSSIANSCLKLLALSVESCPLIGNRSLHTIGKMSLRLHTISLMNCSQLEDSGIISVVSSLPELGRLKISKMKISDNVLNAVANRSRALQFLHLEKIRGLTEIGYSQIASLTELKSLKLRRCVGLTGQSLSFHRNSKLAGLKEIEIQRCGSLTDEFLIELSKSAKQLKRLKFEECIGFTSKGFMESIKNWNQTLKLLSLVKCRVIRSEVTKPGDCLLVEDYPRLSVLELKQCEGVDDEFLSLLGLACGQVKELSLVGMKSFSDQGLHRLLIFLSRSNPLAILDLSGCTAISSRALCDIVKFYGVGLKCLKLAGCGGVNDRIMATVDAHCVALEDLNVEGCAAVTDIGLWCVTCAGKDRLQSLSLARCEGISDDGLKCVEQQMTWGNMKVLDIRDCPRISEQGVVSFQESIWWCKVMC